MISESGQFLDLVTEARRLAAEDEQRAREYSVQSGVAAAMAELPQSRVMEASGFPDNGGFEVGYNVDVDTHHLFIVGVDSLGTVRVQGGFRGSSRIRKEKWEKNPELVDQALAKAYRHPFEKGGFGPY